MERSISFVLVDADKRVHAASTVPSGLISPIARFFVRMESLASLPGGTTLTLEIVAQRAGGGTSFGGTALPIVNTQGGYLAAGFVHVELESDAPGTVVFRLLVGTEDGAAATYTAAVV